MKNNLLLFLTLLLSVRLYGQSEKNKVPEHVMQTIYKEVQTPHKYGLVMVPLDPSKKVDCPTIFRQGDTWYMSYIIYDGRGYETWLAKSDDLLHWQTQGRIMSFSDSTNWDWNQKAGYMALQDYTWGGSYALNKYQNKYWMSYFGGKSTGYEAGLLSTGMAFTEKDPAKVHEWQRLTRPVLMSTDKDVRWWENVTMYKNTVIWDKSKKTGHPFVMYYNAKGKVETNGRQPERIGMAVSNDMVHWQRYLTDPVLDHHAGITGDAYIQQINDVYVMFYFGAFWPGTKGAFNRFACSYDLVNWTDWQGDDLIKPTETYDAQYAHKSFVVKHKGIVYHFYNAVDKNDNRGIAVATSVDVGKSDVTFNQKP